MKFIVSSLIQFLVSFPFQKSPSQTTECLDLKNWNSIPTKLVRFFRKCLWDFNWESKLTLQEAFVVCSCKIQRTFLIISYYWCNDFGSLFHFEFDIEFDMDFKFKKKKTRQMLHSIRKPTLTLFCLSEAEKSFHLVGVNPHTSIVVFAVVVGPCNFRLLLILNCLNNLWGVVFFIIILFFIFMFNEDKRCTTDTLRWSTTSFQNPTHRRQMLIV